MEVGDVVLIKPSPALLSLRFTMREPTHQRNTSKPSSGGLFIDQNRPRTPQGRQGEDSRVHRSSSLSDGGE